MIPVDQCTVCTDHMSDVIASGTELSVETLRSHRNCLRRTLFIISCSHRKQIGGEQPLWRDAILRGRTSAFPELNPLRMQIAETATQKEGIQYFHMALGEFRDIDAASAVNSEILVSPTLRAVERYRGQLYCNLGEEAINRLRSGKANNVLILSALNGPTLPRDLVPNYDLMMRDSIQGELLSSKWVSAIKHDGARLFEFVRGFGRCVAPVSREYKEVAKQVADCASVPFYHLPFKNSGGTPRAGRLLRAVVSEIY